jgi:tryptophan synthase alpha chain
LNRIDVAFARARREGRAAFVPYLTAGDPSADGTVSLARVLDQAGADVLELGVPFSDPVADGPVLQRSAARALASGTNFPAVLRIAEAIRAQTDLAMVLFSYLNPLLHRGLARAAREARAAGFDAVLLTDVPADEGAEIGGVFRREGLDTVFLVSPTSTASRMEQAARLSSGFLYVISRRGTTGARDSLPADLRATLTRARRAVKIVTRRSDGAQSLPIAVGFGIGTPRDARAAAALADGVVVGSALVALAEKTGDDEQVGRFAESLVRACRQRGPTRRLQSPK